TPGWYTGMPDGVEEFDLPVASGEAVEHIHAWWWPAAGGRADAPAILYLHGARWSLTGQLFRIEELRDFGFSVLAVDLAASLSRTDGAAAEAPAAAGLIIESSFTTLEDMAKSLTYPWLPVGL